MIKEDFNIMDVRELVLLWIGGCSRRCTMEGMQYGKKLDCRQGLSKAVWYELR